MREFKLTTNQTPKPAVDSPTPEQPAQKKKLPLKLTREMLGLHKKDPVSPAPEPTRPDEKQQELSPVWDQFKNPYLNQEIAELTEEEKRFIDEMVEKIQKDITMFIFTATKPHSLKVTSSPEHYAFVIAGSLQAWRDLSKEIWSGVSKEIKYALSESAFVSEDVLIKIIDCPNDPKKNILRFITPTPEGTSCCEGRGVGNTGFMELAKDSALISFLRENVNIHLFSFILRNLAMKMHEDAWVYVDAPLEGSIKNGARTTAVVDIPNHQVIKTRKNAEKPPKRIARSAQTDKDLMNLAHTYDAGTCYDQRPRQITVSHWFGLKQETKMVEPPEPQDPEFCNFTGMFGERNTKKYIEESKSPDAKSTMRPFKQ